MKGGGGGGERGERGGGGKEVKGGGEVQMGRRHAIGMGNALFTQFSSF